MAWEMAHHSRLGSRTKVGTVDGRIVDRAGPSAERNEYEKILMCIVVEGFRSGWNRCLKLDALPS